ncbi:MAG: carboxymethylenebutenolidase [Acidimicrobiaceae bacterium]|jgi:carboxymethylenebutenolidase|nr:carboxymethylenebutenolidase [Acidimicrobiaceae bacterium]
MNAHDPAAAAVRVESVALVVEGEEVDTIVCRPGGGTPRAGIVLATEAQGVNAFIRGVGARLAEQGYVVAIPDYYHGRGSEDPDALVDLAHLADIEGLIGGLDFRRGAEDVLAAAAHLRRHEGMGSVAVWGYCTGGTLAMLAACMGRDVDAAVLFYPSQPTFHELSALRPAHPIDLIWQLRCPVLLLVGADDPVWPQDMVAEVARRFDRWSIPLESEVYEGAGHVFAGHFEDWHRPRAEAESWVRALDFLGRRLPSA